MTESKQLAERDANNFNSKLGAAAALSLLEGAECMLIGWMLRLWRVVTRCLPSFETAGLAVAAARS